MVTFERNQSATKDCQCGALCPDRLHLTFLCEAQEGQRPQQKIHDENKFLMPLVRLSTPVPGSCVFLRNRFISEGQPVILALDGSPAKQELYLKSFLGSHCPDTDNLSGRVEVSHHIPRLPAREPFCKPCLPPTTLRCLFGS